MINGNMKLKPDGYSDLNFEPEIIECICIPGNTEVLLLKTSILLCEKDINKMEEEYTRKIGIKCVLLSPRIDKVYAILHQ